MLIKPRKFSASVFACLSVLLCVDVEQKKVKHEKAIFKDLFREVVFL